MNNFEAALIVENEEVISVCGPQGTVYIARAKDSKARLMYVVVAEDEMKIRRTAREAVAIGIHLAGLSVGSQIEGAVHSVGAVGLKAVGKGGQVLGNGLNALAGSFVKMGSLLVK